MDSLSFEEFPSVIFLSTSLSLNFLAIVLLVCTRFRGKVGDQQIRKARNKQLIERMRDDNRGVMELDPFSRKGREGEFKGTLYASVRDAATWLSFATSGALLLSLLYPVGLMLHSTNLHPGVVIALCFVLESYVSLQTLVTSFEWDAQVFNRFRTQEEVFLPIEHRVDLDGWSPFWAYVFLNCIMVLCDLIIFYKRIDLNLELESESAVRISELGVLGVVFFRIILVVAFSWRGKFIPLPKFPDARDDDANAHSLEEGKVRLFVEMNPGSHGAVFAVVRPRTDGVITVREFSDGQGSFVRYSDSQYGVVPAAALENNVFRNDAVPTSTKRFFSLLCFTFVLCLSLAVFFSACVAFVSEKSFAGYLWISAIMSIWTAVLMVVMAFSLCKHASGDPAGRNVSWSSVRRAILIALPVAIPVVAGFFFNLFGFLNSSSDADTDKALKSSLKYSSLITMGEYFITSIIVVVLSVVYTGYQSAPSAFRSVYSGIKSHHVVTPLLLVSVSFVAIGNFVFFATAGTSAHGAANSKSPVAIVFLGGGALGARVMFIVWLLSLRGAVRFPSKHVINHYRVFTPFIGPLLDIEYANLSDPCTIRPFQGTVILRIDAVYGNHPPVSRPRVCCCCSCRSTQGGTFRKFKAKVSIPLTFRGSIERIDDDIEIGVFFKALEAFQPCVVEQVEQATGIRHRLLVRNIGSNAVGGQQEIDDCRHAISVFERLCSRRASQTRYSVFELFLEYYVYWAKRPRP